ncbi:phage tail protein [Enterococcus ureilyticus]|uniref:phage tail spike protein n=1 Tax=Enterococcus ureilyticus TaxID=1131292 RepID=UPI001A911445|nr:phage tail spike protein [Enterococcus ureilyticus]MBO0445547.1 phage tail protein [Enterococcus ureilyticus]
MIIYFADRYMNVLGKASTNLPKGLLITNDLETQEIETGSTIFTTDVNYTTKELDEVKSLTAVGNYILMEDEDQQAKMYTIIERENNRKEQYINIYCEDAGLDLLNEVLDPWSAPGQKQPVSYYVNKAIHDSGFEIGINEIENLSRSLSWDGESTATKRLLSIATQFDHAEIGFSFVVDRMKVTHKYVDIYKKRGNNTQFELRLDKDVDNITTTESIAELATALRVTGGTPEESETPINLNGYRFDNGDIYTDGIYLKSRSALAKWTRYLSEDGKGEGHIVANYTYDTLSQSELCNRAVTQLERVSQIEINYEVDIVVLPESVRIGDTVNIVDEIGELFLEARVLRLERSRSQETAVATLGDYLIKDSGISQQLQDLADKVASIKAGDTYYPWVRYADDDKGNGISSMPLNKKYIAIKYGLNKPTPSDDPKDYEGLWTKIVGSDGQKGDQGIPGPAGQDGKVTYMWIKYADTFNGIGMSDDPAGKKYIGIAYNKTVEKPSTNASDYSWSAMYDEEKLQEMQDKISSIVYSITSPTAPANPVVGQQWWQQDIDNLDEIIGYYIWDGKEWKPQTIQQSILNVVRLNAVEIVGSKITGTDIFGSSVNNTFTVVDQNYTLVGTTTLKDSEVLIDFVVTETNQYGFSKLYPKGIQGRVFSPGGAIQSGFDLNADMLALWKDGKSAGLTFEMLSYSPWRNLPLTEGFQQYASDKCQFRKVANVDGTFTVKFRGTVTTKSGTSWSGDQTIANMPTDARPMQTEMAIQPTNNTGIVGRLHVVSGGGVVFRPQSTNGLTYMSLSGFSYDTDF